MRFHPRTSCLTPACIGTARVTCRSVRARVAQHHANPYALNVRCLSRLGLILLLVQNHTPKKRSVGNPTRLRLRSSRRIGLVSRPHKATSDSQPRFPQEACPRAPRSRPEGRQHRQHRCSYRDKAGLQPRKGERPSNPLGSSERLRTGRGKKSTLIRARAPGLRAESTTLPDMIQSNKALSQGVWRDTN